MNGTLVSWLDALQRRLPQQLPLVLSPLKRRFLSIVKPRDFYSTHASPNEKGQRSYFYNVDLQGRLFLEETFPKNIATSIKDDRFLDFFFRRVRANDTSEGWATDYPYMSICNRSEVNYIRPAACPVVFHSLQMDSKDGELFLIWAGALRVPFSADHLAVSRQSGRLYHALKGGYGLIRSSVAVQLSEYLSFDDNTGWLYDDGGKTRTLSWLPNEYEPGQWGMPTSLDTGNSQDQ